MTETPFIRNLSKKLMDEKKVNMVKRVYTVLMSFHTRTDSAVELIISVYCTIQN